MISPITLNIIPETRPCLTILIYKLRVLTYFEIDKSNGQEQWIILDIAIYRFKSKTENIEIIMTKIVNIIHTIFSSISTKISEIISITTIAIRGLILSNTLANTTEISVLASKCTSGSYRKKMNFFYKIFSNNHLSTTSRFSQELQKF